MVEFDIKMTPSDLYDFNLHHAFNGASGILAEAVGAVGVILGIATKNIPMVIIGAILLVYLPISLYVKVRQTFLLSPVFKEPLHYVLDDEGVSVTQGEVTNTAKWEDVVKAESTGRSLFIYTSRVNATILPRAQMGDKQAQVIQCISTHVEPKKVKIKT
jgi:hypothetical protein